jgi:hypothetical protein
MKISLRALVLAPVLLAASASAAAAQTPDSVLAVSKNGVGLFRVNVDGGALWGGQHDGGTYSGGVPATGAGTRMMWFPKKASFRAGYINGTQWDDANIGYFSGAMGSNARASGDSAFAFGGSATAASSGSFAAGNHVTASGTGTVALGNNAITNARAGSFVFGDRSTTTDSIKVQLANTANWRVANGFRIFNSANLGTGVIVMPATSVGSVTHTWSGCDTHAAGTVFISTSTCATLTNAGVWSNVSDVNRKHLFEPVHGEDVLARLRAMPIQSWSYKVEDASIRHVGPTAQGFHAAFGLGHDEKVIGTVDADGVALAAAQALEARTTAQQQRIDALEARNAALEARIRTLEAQAATSAVLLSRIERLERQLPAHP